MSESSWVVLKFGGTSVSSRARWDVIAEQCQHLLSLGERPFVVCSALSGVSDHLEAIAEKAAADQYRELLDAILQRHREIAKALSIDFDAVCGDIVADLTRILSGSALLQEVGVRQRAQILSAGELMSTRLGALYLQSRGLSAAWLDARTILETVPEPELPTDRQVLSARCETTVNPMAQEMIEAMGADVVLTQGFIARAPAGHTVLLGRGGSDTSATYFAAMMQARRCEIWTDVPGMFTANPRKVPTARLLNRLSYEEAQEIASSGAKVLHPRCIAPARRYGIPIHIRCTPRPDLPGTIISGVVPAEGPQVKAMSIRMGVTLVSMETMGMWQQVGFLADVFQVFKDHGLSVDLVSTSETNVTISLDAGTATSGGPKMEALLSALAPYCRARSIGPCAAVSVVGNQIRGMLHRFGPALEVFEEQSIHLVSQAASDLNITFVVEEDQAERLMIRLHDLLITGSVPTATMGPTWTQLYGAAESVQSTPPADRWWMSRTVELVALGREEPTYVYHLPTVRDRAQGLLDIPSLGRLFYAMKANSNPTILAELAALGAGFECVSPGEVKRVTETLPQLDPQRILFTPNFAPREEYEFGFSQGVHVTLDNIYPLTAWPEIFRGREIIVRMDPGEGRGHHQHVRTAGAGSKFGVALHELPRLLEQVEQCGASIVGLHAHSGSGIRSADNWHQIGMFLGRIAQQIPTVRHIDLGGGLGVVEKAGEAPLNLGHLGEALSGIKAIFPGLEIWMEPGRFLVAEAGVLLTRVTQLKQKGDVRYIGVNAGMNALIRPALYGSWHNIVNISKQHEPPSQIATIVGPICESGDTLGRQRHLPETKEGDVMLVDVVGAYGFSMSSQYNLRGAVLEVCLEERGDGC